MVVVEFKPEHLHAIALQPAQEGFRAFLASGDFAERVARSGPAWTAMVDGEPIACGGFHYPWKGRAQAWAVLSKAAGAHMVALTRAVLRGMRACPAARIEAHVNAAFEAGSRWAEMLGMQREALCRRYHEGQDFWAYVLIREAV
jgi:hypothetical protein